jgi:AraC-like DNA-binding protein
MSNEVYGFRFLDTLHTSFYQLFAVGHQKVREESYEWDGLKRKDGPLYLFQYTVAGFGEIDINGQLHRVEPGRGFLVEIPSVHRYYLPKESEEWEFYFILFRPTKIEKEWDEIIEMLGRIPVFKVDSSPIRFLHSTYVAAAKNQITDGFRASSIVYQFVMELYRYGMRSKKGIEDWPDKITQAVRLLNEEYHSLQSLEEIAAHIQLSKYHFGRLFKKSTGLAPMEYVTKVRIEKAINLLRTTECSIEEIAEQIGYSSSSYFIKVFRSWVGFSPGEFRSGKDLLLMNEIRFS